VQAAPEPHIAAPASRDTLSESQALAIRTAAAAHSALTAWQRPAVLDTWSGERATATMRLLLATCALAVTGLAQREVEAGGAATLMSLAAYAAYSLVVYALVRRGIQASLPTHWADVAWYTLFILLGGGTASPYFSFYFFAILVASFRGGFQAGMLVTLASAVLFTGVGYVARENAGDASAHRAVLRPVFLLVIGFLMARWGGMELDLRRRLVLLKEVAGLANPRFGEAQTVQSVLQRLRSFYRADATTLVLVDAREGTSTSRRTDRLTPEGSLPDEQPLPAEPAELLTGLAWTDAAIFTGGRVQRIPLDAAGGPGPAGGDAETTAWASRVATLLDCRSFVSLPMRYDSAAMARVYVTSKAAAAFEPRDVEFLAMVFDHVMTVVERLRLVDRLASDAAAIERDLIAHDLHDAIIQPYVGLQIGIGAVLQQVRVNQDVSGSLERSKRS
jgi:signal transduction histidine kinase